VKQKFFHASSTSNLFHTTKYSSVTPIFVVLQFEFLEHKNKRIQRYSWLRQKPPFLYKPTHISPVRFNSYPEQESANSSEMLETTYMIAQCHNSEEITVYTSIFSETSNLISTIIS